MLHVAGRAHRDRRQRRPAPGRHQRPTSQLDAQLRLFSIDSSAITLAGVGTTLPVTVISHAPYKVDAVVHLVTDRLSFPKGSAVPVDLTSPTQTIRVATANPAAAGSRSRSFSHPERPGGAGAHRRPGAGRGHVGRRLRADLRLALRARALVVANQPTAPEGSPRQMSVQSTHSQRVLSMASGTLVSRVTGLLRVLVLAYVLGFTPIADSFNLANTVPNMLFDLVLGGVATATFIPVFVERLALDGERRAWKSISSVITGAMIVLVAASALSWVLAPWIIHAFTFLQRSAATSSAVTVAHQRAIATALLRWFVPQIFFYGVIGIATALLNIRRRFGVATWVPVANNLVCIAVLVWFHLIDPTPSLSTLSGSRDLLFLGLGTTAGVAVQFLCLLPSLARSDLWRLGFASTLDDPAVRAVARLGSWTLLVVRDQPDLALRGASPTPSASSGNGPVSAYTYAWSFMQMPYAVVVVSVLGALDPQLAGYATESGLCARSVSACASGCASRSSSSSPARWCS